jgi:nitroreductase
VARKEHEEHYNRVLHALLPKNQRWAYTAPVLMISIARTTFAQSGKPNRHALHDVGLAMGNLIQQATAEELYVHQMAGIDRDAARHEFSIPENHEVVAGVAVGYLGDPDKLSDEFRDKEKEGRRRQPLSDFVYGTAFGVKSELVSG